MRRLFASSILLFATLAPCLAQAAAPDANQVAEIREPAGWSVREVGVGVELRQRRFESGASDSCG